MRRLACLVFLTGFAATAQAQRYEIAPYAGGYFPGKFAGVLELSNDGIYGVKGGIYLTRAIEAEGHFEYINNLAFDGTLTEKRGYIWEGAASYNFRLFGLRPKFYGSAGIGKFTTTVSADSKDFWGPAIPTRDSFLTLSLAGG